MESFSSSALACLPSVTNTPVYTKESHIPAIWTMPQSGINARFDLRGDAYRMFSVDPFGCQNIDDLMHARILPNGNYELDVRIADVDYLFQRIPISIKRRKSVAPCST
mmetsp:Transcript_19138/g.28058  ORF Transcript_19138/g.28058 Transcript_19138/m.28058 type:complete len:108 (-) Transcript_19138:2761-3084(-)